MSWDETKILSDVVTSNLVPSGVLTRSIWFDGNFEVTGNGLAFITWTGFWTSVAPSISADGVNVAVVQPMWNVENPTFVGNALVSFDKNLRVALGSKSHNDSKISVVAYVFFFNRKSIGGGLTLFNPRREAVAA